MSSRFKAHYAAYIEEDYEKAITEIDRVISINPTIQYTRFVKFDISEKFGDIKNMKSIIQFFEESELRSKYHNNYIYMKSLLIKREDSVKEAKKYFKSNIKNYTEQAKERFINRLEK